MAHLMLFACNHDCLSDGTASSNPSWLEKIQTTVKNILQAVNLFQTPMNISGACWNGVLYFFFF